MKNFRKKLNILLVVLLILSAMPLQIFAVGPVDPAKKADLTIKYVYDKTPVYGAELSIFRVASVKGYSEFEVTSQYAKYNLKLDDNSVEEWNKLALTLEGYTEKDQIKPYKTGATDKNGVLTFNGIDNGLYLLLGKKCVNDGYTYFVTPTLIMVPGIKENYNEWEYEVTATPKLSRVPLTSGKTERVVMKVWDDKTYPTDRPSYITVHLMRDGKVIDTQKLDAKMGWTYKWTDLDLADADGAEYRYTISEDPVKYYSTKISTSGVTFVVTNSLDVKHEDPPKPPYIPQTGQLWWPVPMLLCAGAVFLLIGAVRRRREKE